MESSKAFFLVASILLFVSPSSITCRNSPAGHAAANDADRKTYIVQVQPPSDLVLTSSEDKAAWYETFLPETTSGAGSDASRMVFAYSEVFSGFAARLSVSELEAMAKKTGFVRAFPEVVVPLATTHTPKFLGLQRGRGLWKSSQLGRGVIIGMLDTGINPAHPSFADDGLPAPPSKWKGGCDFEKCNNKVIGGKSLLEENGVPPLDADGHGSHTASTAAGNFVEDANFLGEANGTASGIAPHAHLAIYKICNSTGCLSAAILAGLDAGVKDGVDILSLSLGAKTPQPFYDDPIAIGAFAAVEKGIFVSCAGGNEGPEAATITNTAPWILTVAASTHDHSHSGASPAPVIADFSSRGPNSPSPKILKPDVTGPGVNILAAWPFAVDGGESSGDAHFNIISGTSMSTPHLSGVAALLKSLHPDWSPAAIKSAIVTSSDPDDNSGAPIKDENLDIASFYSKGAGHVNPAKAADPGLVFDAVVNDYIGYLCNLYSDSQVASIIGRAGSCADVEKIDESQLNYPSIVVKSDGDEVNRTATNVGSASSSYTVEVDVPTGLSVTVSPKTIKFSKKGEKKSFSVIVKGSSGSEGYLKLVSDDEKHVVRIPVMVAAEN